MSQTPLQINFPAAERQNLGDSKLYSFAEVPSMERLEEDYVLFLTVRAAEPAQERLLADTCTRAISASPLALAAMQLALNKLDSVAFLLDEGDTDEVKSLLRKAMSALAAPSSPLNVDALIN
ncbi:hypothetical protein ACEN2T_17715 [Pseudomonas sp. W22_MBD1_FP4]|uniref:hypothetical protein n=1 Tax=Pseudomonas sp. W22_MBD1_FP4 TaxID=3240272 RepID=UPI003F9B8F50